MGLCGAFTQAKVQLPAFFSDGMVMQQQATANLWGTATPRKTVTLTTGWDGKTYRATADTQGKWNMSVTTPPAGGPYSLTFSDGELTVLNNILIGELWICSGQSNMEMPMKGYKNQPIEGADMDILRSTNPSLRLFTVKRHSTLLPQYDVTGTWNEAMPTTVREFSATAYYFGRLLNELLDVPVGLIVTAWGGSAAEAWMTEEMLRAFPEVRIPRTDADITSPNRTPTTLYNGMLHPLIGITMRGVIWYQGEDNTNRPHSYADMFTTLINGCVATGRFSFLLLPDCSLRLCLDHRTRTGTGTVGTHPRSAVTGRASRSSHRHGRSARCRYGERYSSCQKKTGRRTFGLISIN